MALFLAMPASEKLANELAELTASDRGRLDVRPYPDGETYVRLHSTVAGEDVFVVCNLAPPDRMFLPLVFAARTVRERGARRVTLVAPYLPYLRQDKAFREGEAVSSRIFADLVSREFDLVVTVDPHLHRYRNLSEVYDIPTVAVSASKLIGEWVQGNVRSPLILGPDAESAQWAKAIADASGAPWATFNKARRGDRDIRLTAPLLDEWRDHHPVLVDDIISSGETMISAAKLLALEGLSAPHCIAIHGLFDQATGSRLEGLTTSFGTTDTVPNKYAKFPIAPLIAGALSSNFLAARMPLGR